MGVRNICMCIYIIHPVWLSQLLKVQNNEDWYPNLSSTDTESTCTVNTGTKEFSTGTKGT